MLTRRQFLASLVPGLALLSGGATLAYVGYRRGSCPLSNEGRCVGPCSALLDADGNKLCDRISSTAAQALPAESDTQSADAVSPTVVSLSPTAESMPLPTTTQQATAMPTATPVTKKTTVSCPFGQVNDKYPGRCGRYVDRNGNKICDLSEPR